MGDFTKSQAERPLSSRGRAGPRGWGGTRGLGERADDLDDDTTKNQMHGHWLFSIRIIGFPGRRSSEPPRPSRYSFSLSLSLSFSPPPSLSLSLSFSLFLSSPCSLFLRLLLPPLSHRHLLRRASTSSPPSGMGAGEKGRKNLEKKIQFRCHGDRRALTLIKIPRTSHLRLFLRPLYPPPPAAPPG